LDALISSIARESDISLINRCHGGVLVVIQFHFAVSAKPISVNYKAFQINKRWFGFHELNSEQIMQLEFLTKHIKIDPK
jgi:hypothetical protein